MTQPEFLKAMNWRYAVKRFDSARKVNDVDWKTLEESLRLSPSSYGLQPWNFLVVQNPDIRKKLLPVSWNQSQVVDCSHFVVFATLTAVTENYIDKFIQKTAAVRGVNADTLKAYRDMMVGDLVKGPRAPFVVGWSQRQAYIAMGTLMTTAALIGVDTCPMEGLDPKQYDQILGLSSTPYATVAAVAVGYRHADDKYQNLAKVRFDTQDVIQLIH